jgi:hypothetical protein
MVAGIAGVPLTLTVPQMPVGLTSFVGYALALLVRGNFEYGRRSLPVTLGEDGVTISRTLLATDFPIGSNYEVMLQATNDAIVLYSDPTWIYAAPQVLQGSGCVNTPPVIGAANYDLTVLQGADFDDVLTLTNDDGTPYDLTGASAALMVRASYSDASPTISLTSETDGGLTLDIEAGTIDISISAAMSAAIPIALSVLPTPGDPPYQTFVYDLTVTAGGKTERVVEGNLTIVAGVTR